MKIYLLCVIDKVLCFPRKSAATGVWVKAFHLHQTLKTKKAPEMNVVCRLSGTLLVTNWLVRYKIWWFTLQFPQGRPRGRCDPASADFHSVFFPRRKGDVPRLNSSFGFFSKEEAFTWRKGNSVDWPKKRRNPALFVKTDPSLTLKV